MAVPVEHGVGVEVTPALTAAAGEAAWAVDWREALAGGTPAVSVPMVAAPSQPAAGFASEDWVSVRDNEGLLDILDSLKAAHSRLMGQPTPPGAYDLPPAVVLLSASGEAAAAEAAGKEYKTDHRNRQHVESVAPLGALASGARATELLLQPARIIPRQTSTVWQMTIKRNSNRISSLFYPNQSIKRGSRTPPLRNTLLPTTKNCPA